MAATVNRGFRAALSLSPIVLAFSCACAHADEVKDIPLDKCNAATAIMTVKFSALQRQGKNAEPAQRMLNQILAITAKHKDAQLDKPIGDALTKQESAEFATLTGQLAVSGYYKLAESRLERDMSVLKVLLEVAGKLRHDKPLPKETSPEARYYGYLDILREVFNGLYRPDSKNRGECSLDLALEQEAKEAVTAMTDSTEYLELLGLRSKYGLAEGAQFDVSKLSPLDSARLHRVQDALSGRAMRGKVYDQDISNLRYFADIVQMEFEWQKTDILQLGASSVAEYNKLQKARFASLSPVIQKGVNLWFYIDSENPSDASKDAAARAQFMKQSTK